MSINNYYDSVEDVARVALLESGAVEVCSFHPDVTVRIGDDDAERRAYAIATNLLKREGEYWMREDVMPAIADQLVWAADDECPQCAHLANT